MDEITDHMDKPVTAIIVGAGHRSMVYANYALAHLHRLHIRGASEVVPLEWEAVPRLDLCVDPGCTGGLAYHAGEVRRFEGSPMYIHECGAQTVSKLIVTVPIRTR